MPASADLQHQQPLQVGSIKPKSGVRWDKAAEKTSLPGRSFLLNCERGGIDQQERGFGKDVMTSPPPPHPQITFAPRPQEHLSYCTDSNPRGQRASSCGFSCVQMCRSAWVPVSNYPPPPPPHAIFPVIILSLPRPGDQHMLVMVLMAPTYARPPWLGEPGNWELGRFPVGKRP